MSKNSDVVTKSGARAMSLSFRSAVVVIAIMAAASAASAQRRLPKTTSPTARMKGIWEPVNYNQDLTLRSVYFVTPNIGWASGEGGTIIKTLDAGAHWTPQLGGDPQNAARPIGDLRFVDQRHGFAVQSTGVGDHLLLRTVDGQTWRASGTVPQHRGDYLFISPTVGFASTGNEIRRTRDAGRSWQKAMDCAATITVDGLSRNVACSIESISFPTPQVGYGAGTGEGVKGVFIVKTTDGGNTWAISRVLDDESAHQGFITFNDANNGFVCTYGGKFFSTSDGGRTWDGVAGVDCGGNGVARFADPEVGWTLTNRRWNYTSDGGRSWSTRSMNFPAGVNGFSIPRRDRGYAVGDHGMVYRYSVVPVDHTAPNSIDAPPVGTFSSPLDDQVEEFVAEVDAFSAESGGPAGSSNGSGSAFDAGGSASGSGSSGSSASSSGTTGSSGSVDPAGGTPFDAGSGASGANAKAKRGGNRLGKLQALLDVIGSSMPDFFARYRNLNLLFEGARTAAGMPTWLQTVKGGLAAFKSSTDKAGAAAALAQLVGAADSLRTQTRVAFMQTSFTPGPEDSASGFSSMSSPAAADPNAAGAKQSVADSVAKAAKDAAKKGLGGLLKNPFGKKH